MRLVEGIRLLENEPLYKIGLVEDKTAEIDNKLSCFG